MLALDFDCGITPEEAFDRMQAYDITPNQWYPTFSDSPDKRKFRLIFNLDRIITNIDARNYLMDALLMMYPEADKSCRDPARFFYGTDKQGQVLNHKALSVDILFSVLESDKIKNGARTRKIKAGSKGARFLRKIGESCASYINTIEDTENANQRKNNYYEKLTQNKNGKNVD